MGRIVKLTIARGAAVDDSDKLFNSSLERNVRRAIDIRGETINEVAFTRPIRIVVAANEPAVAERAASKKK